MVGIVGGPMSPARTIKAGIRIGVEAFGERCANGSGDSTGTRRRSRVRSGRRFSGSERRNLLVQVPSLGFSLVRGFGGGRFLCLLMEPLDVLLQESGREFSVV
ncbi:hypothetical protein ABIB45_002476 [Arthrobacter sp. UYCo732]